MTMAEERVVETCGKKYTGAEGMGHVMISYNWGAQERMLKLRDELKRAGYQVWMDVDNMEDNMDDLMAEAVEKASAILMCFSENYQASASCKKEAQYARDQNKLIIPLKYENYKPSGWLGLMINSMLYYDVRSDDAMITALPSILKRLSKNNASLLRQDGEIQSPMPSSKHADFVNKVATKLKRFYLDNQCKKQLYPWTKKGGHVDLESLFVPVTIDIPIPGPTPIKERLDSYLDIFNEQQTHTRYCIFAKPGQGKSTLCVKLAYDWCQKKALQHIQLLFILQLGLIKKGTCIEDAICSQLKLNDVDPVELGRVIRDLEDEVVILFDSLDEAPRDLLDDSDDVTGSIVKIIRREVMEECRVLVTTRPWRTDITDIAAYKRLELQPFKKSDLIAYVKKFFGQNNDPNAIVLGKGLVKVINENKLLIDASTPLMALLICWYWLETKGKGIPDRVGELYDAVVKIMHKSNRRPEKKDVIIEQLGKVAVEGLTPTDTKLVFTENEMKACCEAVDQACAMGIIRSDKTMEHGKTLQFFHKSAQEFCAGKYLSNHVDELCAYLEEVEAAEDALSVALVLTFASSQKTAAKMIVERLMEIFQDEIQPEMSEYKREKIAFEDTRPIQEFVELLLECNYEADAGAEFASLMTDLFADGKVLFYGIPPKAAITLAYYIKHSKPPIDNVTLRPIAHASEPPMFFGPIADRYNAAMQTFSSLTDKEIRERYDKFRGANQDLHKSWTWERRGRAQLAAYIMSIQACEGLPCASETNVVPIINSLKFIELHTLNLANFKLGADFDYVIKALEDDHLQSLSTMRVETTASRGQQMTRLVTSLSKMPLLDTLIISKNPAEPGQTIPRLAENISACRSLRYLSVCDMQAPADDMVLLAPKLPPKLEVLYLRGNEMNDALGSCLVDALPRTLKRLYIDVDSLSVATHNELLKALETRCTFLTALGVYRSPYAEELIKHLGQALQATWREMTKLNLSSSSQDLIRRDCFEIFMAGIKEGNVVNMCIQGINLDQEGFEEWIQVCCQKSFQDLRFSRASLPAEGISVEEYDFVTLVD